MRLDDETADGQSHAGTGRFGGKECIERLLRLFWLPSQPVSPTEIKS
jgi:hypothetical protein